MTTRLVTSERLSLTAATLAGCLVSTVALAADGIPDSYKTILFNGDGGVGGSSCPYVHDDGTFEFALTFQSPGWQGIANAYTADPGCAVVNVIQVAWNTLGAPSVDTYIAIYDDPNDDGVPDDIGADQLVVAAFSTANETSFNLHGVGNTDVSGLGVFFVAALANVATAGAGPLLDDTDSGSQMSSWFLFSDPSDPFNGAGSIDDVAGGAFAGNFPVRADFRLADECEDAIPVAEGDYDGSTLENTGDVDDTSCAPGDTIDVWYAYTASCNGPATISTCDQADYDTTLAVFDACDGAEIACNDDGDGCSGFTSQLSFGATSGTTYYVRVSGWSGDAGNYTLSITCEGKLTNDDCAEAVEIFDGLTIFNTSDATTDGPDNPEGVCNDFGQNGTYNDIWFDYTAICTGTLLVTTCEELGGSAAYDSDIVVYEGTECPVDNDRLLGCNDDDPDNPCGTDNFHSTVRVPVVAGESYKIRVGGWGPGDAGAGELLVDCQPENDDCDDALEIFDGLTPFTTAGATTDGPDNPPGICSDFGNNETFNDIWFDYTATCTGELLVTTCEDLGGSAQYDTDLVVYEGTECPVDNDRLLGCNDDDTGNPCGNNDFHSTVRVPVVAGESYKIRVGGWGPGDAGPGELLVQCTASGPPPILNEIRIDQPGSDTDEYIELRGTPGSSMTGLSIVIIGDGVGGSGIIEEVIDLTGQVIPPGEHFLIAEGDVFGVEPDLTTGLNMENSDNVTYLLVSGFSGAEGNDLDPDDDCTLDVTPWDEVLDALGLVETTDSGDCYYGASLGFEDIGPDGTFVPAHVYRCDPEGEWRIGSFDPDDGTDTPRALNLPCCMSTLILAPAVRVDPLGYDPGDEVTVTLSMEPCEPLAGFQAFIEFDEAELALVSGAYTPAPFGQPIIDPITAVGGTIDLAAGIDQTIGQTPSDAAAILVELVFEAQQSFCLPSSLAFRDNIPPTKFSDPEGNEVAAALSTDPPTSCLGDANLDGYVDVDDLMAVVMDYGNTDPCGADTDGSGVVDVDDLVLVILYWGPCGNLGVVVPP